MYKAGNIDGHYVYHFSELASLVLGITLQLQQFFFAATKNQIPNVIHFRLYKYIHVISTPFHPSDLLCAGSIGGPAVPAALDIQHFCRPPRVGTGG